MAFQVLKGFFILSSLFSILFLIQNHNYHLELIIIVNHYLFIFILIIVNNLYYHLYLN